MSVCFRSHTFCCSLTTLYVLSTTMRWRALCPWSVRDRLHSVFTTTVSRGLYIVSALWYAPVFSTAAAYNTLILWNMWWKWNGLPRNWFDIYAHPVPSVLWRCWLGGRKGIRPVKNWVTGAGMVICLERGADSHMAQLMPLPFTVSCFSKIQIAFTFLAPDHLGGSGKGPLNRCVRVCVSAHRVDWLQALCSFHLFIFVHAWADIFFRQFVINFWLSLCQHGSWFTAVIQANLSVVTPS